MKKFNKQSKRVQFSNLVKVHLYDFDQDKRESKIFWLIELLKFEEKIKKFEKKSRYIFSRIHREYIFLSRFDNDEYIKDKNDFNE